MKSSVITRRPGGSPWHPAWLALAVTFLVLLSAAAVRATPGVLFLPLEHEFHWSRSTVSLAVSVNILLYGLVGPFAGALMQRLRARVQLDEPGLLAALQRGQAAAVHGRPGHGRCVLWGFTFRVSCLIGAGGGAVDRGVRSGEVRCPRPGHACVPGLQAAQLSNE